VQVKLRQANWEHGEIWTLIQAKKIEYEESMT
jgi:hypothetical protein